MLITLLIFPGYQHPATTTTYTTDVCQFLLLAFLPLPLNNASTYSSGSMCAS